jgi:hypothetical protein
MTGDMEAEEKVQVHVPARSVNHLQPHEHRDLGERLTRSSFGESLLSEDSWT